MIWGKDFKHLSAPAPSATICRSISPRRRVFLLRHESTSMPVRISQAVLRPLAAAMLALSLTVVGSAAYADEYSEINQLLRSGKAAEALERSNAGLAKNARDPQMRFLQAVALAVRNNPNFALAYENLADVYIRLAYQNYAKSVSLDGRMASTVNPKLTLVRQLLNPPAKPAEAAQPAAK